MDVDVLGRVRLEPFAHVALLYDGDAEFLAGTVPFVEAGLDAGEPSLIAVPSERLRLIEGALGPAARDLVRYAPMEDLGRNPAWIIPAWAEFIAPHLEAGRPVRGIGEPVWAGRNADELIECDRHEALLNLAMDGVHGFSLLCPYDIGSLGADVIAGAHRNHPRHEHAGCTTESHAYASTVPVQLTDPLPPPPAHAERVRFGRDDAWSVRRRLASVAGDAGLDAERLEDLAVAASEALSNSVEHGGGSGEIVWWAERDRFVCEIRDVGEIDDPLVGRVRPDPTRGSGRGMWLIHQLCDLVQIRHLPGGCKAIRLHLTT